MPRDWLMRSPVHFGGRYTLDVLIKSRHHFKHHGSWSFMISVFTIQCSKHYVLHSVFFSFSSPTSVQFLFWSLHSVDYSCASTVDWCISHITIYSFQFWLICSSFVFQIFIISEDSKQKTNWRPKTDDQPKYHFEIERLHATVKTKWINDMKSWLKLKPLEFVSRLIKRFFQTLNLALTIHHHSSPQGSDLFRSNKTHLFLLRFLFLDQIYFIYNSDKKKWFPDLHIEFKHWILILWQFFNFFLLCFALFQNCWMFLVIWILNTEKYS